MSAPPGSPPIAPPTPEQQAALILASIDKGATIGVAYLGVAISAMYVSSIVDIESVGSRSSCRIYGVTCIQTFQYYRSEKARADMTFLRFIVCVFTLLLFFAC